MPWFYFIPYKLSSTAESRARPRLFNFKLGDVLLYLAVSLILLGLFAAFVVIPTVMALRETVPAG